MADGDCYRLDDFPLPQRSEASAMSVVGDSLNLDQLEKQMIERAHEKGRKIFGATLTPFEGTVFPGYFTPEKETQRKAVNEWIRTANAFDGVVDFDKAIRDPQHPDRMLAAYDGGDHLHPGDAGYKAMADAVDLSLFK